MSSLRNQFIEEAIQYLDERGGSYTPELMADFLINHPRVVALENLRDAVGNWCESCRAEVQEALHAVPGIEITHFAHEIVEPEFRMQRLREKYP